MFKVQDYWENRYKSGRDSGAGSYGEEAIKKAHYVNEVINHFNIMSVTEIGCGDGNNLGLYENFTEYNGYDISEKAVELCVEKFTDERYFFTADKNQIKTDADLCLCLDVLFHQVEDELYYETLDLLFKNNFKYVLIYTYDYLYTNDDMAAHMKIRYNSYDIEKRNYNYNLINRSCGYDARKSFILYEKK